MSISPPEQHHELLGAYVPHLLRTWAVGEPHRTIDGTLVSADISGFTALSERLAAKGREGAEELSNLINDCFEGMIADCSHEGGDILKFGGDAILVLFAGAEHERRACRASVGMRHTIAVQRRTGDGRKVKLAVSIGVHSGLHTCFVVTNGHGELVVTGPGTTATVDAESAALAGEILLTAQTAARLPASWLGVTVPDGVLLRRTFAATRAQADEAAEAQSREVSPMRSPTDFIAGEQRAQIEAGAANEHRQVSVCFLMFAGTDALPADEVHRRLQALADVVWRACERYGVFWLGTDVYHDGGKFIVAAGAPISHGGDEDRLLHAVREITDADPGLNLRAGVNRGYVFAGDLGARSRRTYTAMGDAMNLAARLMSKAGPGEVLVSRPMIDWASSEVEYVALEPFLVKGKSMPIRAGVLGRIIGRRSDLDGVDTELCGRSDELGSLLAMSDAALAGRSGTALISGEAGIGKSRLAVEVLRQRPALEVVFVRCQPYDRLTAYAVAEPMLRSLLGIDSRATAAEAGTQLLAWMTATTPSLLTMAPLLATTMGAVVEETTDSEAVTPEFRQARTVQLVVELLRLGLERPTAIVVDDVNLADDASRALLSALVGSTVEAPLLVMMTSGVDDQLHPQPLRLGPLGEQAVGRLLDALLGEQTISAEVVRSVVARAAGNPLFLGELVRSLAEDPHAAMPPSLEALVAEHVDALEPSDRQLLRQASVLGTEVDIGLLGRITGDDLIRRQDRWERLSRFFEWAGPGVVRFRYDTYWRVVYEGLPFASRRAAHRRVVDALAPAVAVDDFASLALLATHAQRAGDKARAWTFAVPAARNAGALALFREAAGLYDVALASHLGSATPEWRVVAEAAAEVFVMSGRFHDADDLCGALLRGVPDDHSKARVLRMRGRCKEQLGVYAEADRHYHQARLTLRRAGWSSSVLELARVEVELASLEYRRGSYEQAWEHATAALAQATMLQDFELAARAAMTVDSVLMHLRWAGGPMQRPDVLDLCRRAGDRAGEAAQLNNLAVDCYFDGDWGEAARLYRRSAQLSGELGDVVREANALNNLAEILSDQGDVESAGELFRSALRSYQAAGFEMGVVYAEANLGRANMRAGHFDDAHRYLSLALDRSRRVGAQGMVDEVLLRLIENRLAGGVEVSDERWNEVRLMMERGDVDATLATYGHRLLAVRAWLLGDALSATTAVNRSVEAARRACIPFELAQSLELRAVVVGASDDAAEANNVFQSLAVLIGLRPLLTSLEGRRQKVADEWKLGVSTPTQRDPEPGGD